MTPFVSAGLHLALQASVDTVYVATQNQGWFQKVTSIASTVMTLTLLAMAIALVPAAWNFRKTYKRTSKLLDQVQADVAPLIKHAHSIADNVDYISTAIRADLTMIQGTLATANERLQEAIVTTEGRMNEFNALLDVVQDEAEGIFVTTAATVRGVRTGASHFVRDNGPELASVEADDAVLEAGVNDEEIEYGYDVHGGADDYAVASRAPRIIRRSRTR